VRPHWRNAVAAAVNRFTGDTQIRHFVMAITTESDGAPLPERRVVSLDDKNFKF
jgi:hypothetical protein